MKWHRAEKGEGTPNGIKWLLAATLVLILLSSFVVPSLNLTTVDNAIGFLRERGYYVLASSEYDAINTKLDSIATKADAAVLAAQGAVIAAQTAATKIDLFNSAEVYLFPSATNLNCLLTAGNTNIWSAWTEVADNATTTLSSSFAVNSGYVSDMLFFLPSDAADGYNIELAYGDAKTTLGRTAFWALASGDVAYVMPIKSRRVPAGETIYYRMQSTGANGATVQARFRYFYE